MNIRNVTSNFTNHNVGFLIFTCVKILISGVGNFGNLRYFEVENKECQNLSIGCQKQDGAEYSTKIKIGYNWPT